MQSDVDWTTTVPVLAQMRGEKVLVLGLVAFGRSGFLVQLLLSQPHTHHSRVKANTSVRLTCLCTGYLGFGGGGGAWGEPRFDRLSEI